MGVRHHNARDMKDVALNEIGRLPPYAGQAQQVLHLTGDLSVVFRKQHLGALHHVPALAPEKAAGVDVLPHLLRIRLGKGLEGWKTPVEGRRHLVHPLVRTLGGEPDGKEQLIVLLILQGAQGVRIALLQCVNDRPDCLFCFHRKHPLVVLYHFSTTSINFRP